MKRISIIGLALAAALAMNNGPAFAAGAEGGDGILSLQFGKGADKVSYYNTSIPDFEEAYPQGPYGFVTDEKGKVAVLDTFAGAVKFFSSDCKAAGSVEVAKIAAEEAGIKDAFLSSLSLYKNGEGATELFVADAVNSKIYRIRDGKLVKAYGSKGIEKYEFTQLEKVSVTSSGKIVAGDYGNEKISVLSLDGKGLFDIAWDMSGFFCEGDELFMMKKLKSGEFLVYRYDLNSGRGKALFQMTNAAWRFGHLVGRTSSGSFVGAFFNDSIQESLRGKVPNDKMGYYTMSLISPAGKEIESFEVPVTTPLGSQFFFAGEGKVLWQDFDAFTAPEGNYRIKKLEFTNK